VSSRDDNQQWRLARRPAQGWPTDGDFELGRTPIPSPGPGQMLTRTRYLSMDPYQWGRRRAGLEKPGEVCHGRTVSQVVASRLDGYAEGDFVFNTNGWQTHGLTGEGISAFGYMFPRKLDPDAAPLSTALGVMGMLGLTAYSGLIVQCAPRRGETVLVSAASGGVGQVAVQLAKQRGCRVVGVAGSEAKCTHVVQALGADACVSHRDPAFAEALADACPDGIDVYFENVGGAVFEAVLPLLQRGARITLCGVITQYGNMDGANPRDAWMALGQPTFDRQGVQVHDLFVGNFVEAHQARFLEEMAPLVAGGEVTYREYRVEGLSRAPEAFAAMLAGDNFGKTLVVVDEQG